MPHWGDDWGSDFEPERRGYFPLSLVQGEKADLSRVPSDVQSSGDMPEVRASQVAGLQDGRHLNGKRAAWHHPLDSDQNARVDLLPSLANATHFGFKQVRRPKLREAVHALGVFDYSMLFELNRDHY